ncbi:hypothetical protein [Streptomyces lasiicapitis]|uniref:hypothetical protein n=1 Tax=Streptomyces lasiicapitis TaxID=1923961 RepID=UPI0036C3740A
MPRSWTRHRRRTAASSASSPRRPAAQAEPAGVRMFGSGTASLGGHVIADYVKTFGPA